MRTILFATLLSVLFTSGALSDSNDADITTTSTLAPTTHAPTTSTTEKTTKVPTTHPTTHVPTTEPHTTTINETTTPFQTTTPFPTTTPVPTKAPKPPVPSTHKGTWNVTEGNVTCIMAELEVLFTIPFEDVDYYIALSPDASTQGSSCNVANNTQMLVLSDANSTLTLVFIKDSSDRISVNNVSFSYKLPVESGFVHNDSKMFPVKSGNSYLCKSDEDVQLSNVTMLIKTIHLQAFGDEKTKEFATAEECKADDKVGDAVPIAVACALAALIIVVLIAYLVGRRRSRQRGYQSV